MAMKKRLFILMVVLAALILAGVGALLGVGGD
jgi:predicted small secreted protein